MDRWPGRQGRISGMTGSDLVERLADANPHRERLASAPPRP
jgi:hypothetical protein